MKKCLPGVTDKELELSKMSVVYENDMSVSSGREVPDTEGKDLFLEEGKINAAKL